MTAQYIPTIASQSLGRAQYHDLETKLAACARHGFKAIELFYEDLEAVARSLPPSTTWEEQLLAAASYIYTLCTTLDITILCLQPFMHYEGLLSPQEHTSRIAKLHLWFRLADALHTDLIQIPSNFLPESHCTASRAAIVADLTEVADLGLAHTPNPIRFAYEALCWGTHIDTWDAAWEIVQAVNRDNFGTCIDTFNLAGRIWADPAATSGTTPTAAATLAASMQKLISTIDPAKIFYLEVVDAERLPTPLDSTHPWHRAEQKARMSWSRNARLFPFEERGYLPIMDVVRAVTESVGWSGYVSFELFSRTCNVPGASVPEDHARRGGESWRRLEEVMGWNKSGEKGELTRQDSGVDVGAGAGAKLNAQTQSPSTTTKSFDTAPTARQLENTARL